MNAITKIRTNEISPARHILQAGFDSLSPATQKLYTADLRAFHSIVGKDIPKVTLTDIPKYIKALEVSGFKNSTINRKIYSISRIFNLYKLAGLIENNPISELSKIKKITRTTTKQIDAQVEFADLQAVGANGKTSLIIQTLANTGLRISELINIWQSDVVGYSEGGKSFKRIRILGKGKRERYIFLSEALYSSIKEEFDQNSPFLFHSASGQSLHRVNLHKQIKHLFKRVTGKNIHPHSFRHFFATHKINAEKQDIKAVSKYLGHSGTSITLDMYVDTALNAENCMLKGEIL